MLHGNLINFVSICFSLSIIRVEPKPLQFKLQKPSLLLLGKDRYSEVDIRIRVKGSGRIAQIYDIQHAQRIRGKPAEVIN
jgi:hypothetical protein